MIRLLLIVLLAILGVGAAYALIQSARRRQWDWRAIGLAAAFILLAILFRHATGIGGVADV